MCVLLAASLVVAPAGAEPDPLDPPDPQLLATDHRLIQAGTFVPTSLNAALSAVAGRAAWSELTVTSDGLAVRFTRDLDQLGMSHFLPEVVHHRPGTYHLDVQVVGADSGRVHASAQALTEVAPAPTDHSPPPSWRASVRDLADRQVPGYELITSNTTARREPGTGHNPHANDCGDWTVHDDSSLRPSSWHGTHVAGTTGAATDDNDTGVAGVDQAARLQQVRAIGAGGGSLLDLNDAIRSRVGGRDRGRPGQWGLPGRWGRPGRWGP